MVRWKNGTVTVFQISSTAFCRVLSGIWCRYWAHARKALWAGKPWRFVFFPLGFLTIPLAANVSGFYRKHDDIFLTLSLDDPPMDPYAQCVPGGFATLALILVGGLEHECYFSIFFHIIGNNNPNWLIYFSEGLKPPTSIFAWLSGSCAPGMRVAGWLPPTWAQRWIRQTATPSLRQGGMMGPARAHWCDTTRWANGRLTSGHNIKIKLKETAWITGFCACLFRNLLGQVHYKKCII